MTGPPSTRQTAPGEARGCRATKKITTPTPEGVHGYAAGIWLATTTPAIEGFAQLAEVLEQSRGNSHGCVIRGELIERGEPGRVLRLVHPDKRTGDQPYFAAKARRPLGVDQRP